MTAETLPGLSDNLGGSALEDVARDHLAGVDVSDPGRRVLAVLILQLARSIDASAARGRASAAAMAAKELREALAQLAEVSEADVDLGAQFVDFAAALRDSVAPESASGQRPPAHVHD